MIYINMIQLCESQKAEQSYNLDQHKHKQRSQSNYIQDEVSQVKSCIYRT